MKNEDTKRRILTEALQLFSVRGYEAVAVEQIAAAVGIRAPSLYKHYRSKRDIFRGILARMEELDAENARACEMPEGTPAETAEAYRNVPLERVRTYTRAMFLYWTENAFAAAFRRLLTLEQYHDPEMARLFQQYLAGGPLAYMADVFRDMADSDETARQLALAFYGPVFLLYSVYDGTGDREQVLAELEWHMERFIRGLEAGRGGETHL